MEMICNPENITPELIQTFCIFVMMLLIIDLLDVITLVNIFMVRKKDEQYK